jgi:o-succinylbenzoate synthase
MARLRLARIGLRAFDLPLARPLHVGGRTLERRSGLLVIAEDGEGHAGIGETAPLPGLHRESIDEAEEQLLAAARELDHARIPEGCPGLEGAFEDWLGGRGLFPSVRSGIEGAVLTLLADRAGIDLPHLLAARPAARVPVNGLLDGDPAIVLEDAVRLAAVGFTALKIKVGRREPVDEAHLVTSVRTLVKPSVALRLDANRAWELSVARDFARTVAPAAIEYLEEPLRDPDDLAGFVAHAPVPVALDETLLDHSPEAPPPLRGVAALILKISVLGGFERAMVWARLAQRELRAAVVSAAFPSAVGLSLDAAFAAAVGCETVHGLGTSSSFAEDLAREPLVIEGGHLDVLRLPLRPADFALERTRVLR